MSPGYEQNRDGCVWLFRPSFLAGPDKSVWTTTIAFGGNRTDCVSLEGEGFAGILVQSEGYLAGVGGAELERDVTPAKHPSRNTRKNKQTNKKHTTQHALFFLFPARPQHTSFHTPPYTATAVPRVHTTTSRVLSLCPWQPTVAFNAKQKKSHPSLRLVVNAIRNISDVEFWTRTRRRFSKRGGRGKTRQGGGVVD